jgi:hypothetical protein
LQLAHQSGRSYWSLQVILYTDFDEKGNPRRNSRSSRHPRKIITRRVFISWSCQGTQNMNCRQVRDIWIRNCRQARDMRRGNCQNEFLCLIDLLFCLILIVINIVQLSSLMIIVVQYTYCLNPITLMC